MNRAIIQHVNAHHQHSTARMKVCDFVDSFRATLREPERKHWERWRIVEELSEVFEVATDSDKCQYLCGLCPKGEWKAGPDGRLIMSAERARNHMADRKPASHLV